MQNQTTMIHGVDVPRILYGTAWKEDETQRLTELALQLGFRGIDTANQRRHYHEAAVGQALNTSIQKGILKREDLFLQTKFTFRPGQDDRLPYDPSAPIARQVEQSFASSLNHLGCNLIDSYVLHGPSQRTGLGAADWEAWRAMETLHAAGRVRMLGISNISLQQLKALLAQARIQPSFVQNRCYAAQGWDREIRVFCRAQGIIYQGFSLLTANRALLSRNELLQLAIRRNCSVSQLVFRFALGVGMIALTGTTDPHHMTEDLRAHEIQLEPEEIDWIESIAAK